MFTKTKCCIPTELAGDEKVHILLSLFTSSKGGTFQRRIKSTKN